MDTDVVRSAVPADVAEIHRVLSDAFFSLLPRYTAAARPLVVPSIEVIRRRLDEGAVWVHDRGAIRGTVSAALTGEGCYLRSMAVDPMARHLGIGDALVESVVRWAGDRGVNWIRLHTTSFLHPAIALYRKHGFRFVPEEDSTLQGTPLVAMERSLLPGRRP